MIGVGGIHVNLLFYTHTHAHAHTFPSFLALATERVPEQ